jgi:hypothetical protein
VSERAFRRCQKLLASHGVILPKGTGMANGWARLTEALGAMSNPTLIAILKAVRHDGSCEIPVSDVMAAFVPPRGLFWRKSEGPGHAVSEHAGPLNEFCRRHGLSWRRDYRQQSVVFTGEKWPKPPAHPDWPATREAFATGVMPPEILADFLEDVPDPRAAQVRTLKVREYNDGGIAFWYVGVDPIKELSEFFGETFLTPARATDGLRARVLALLGG